jgi:plasmid stabilization system protein ParE
VRYTVVWSPEAERELTDIWSSASDHQGIANAANLLDRDLAHAPTNLGESRPSGLRIAHFLPLGIRFAVSEEDRLVRVLAVWQCRRSAK